MIDRLKQRIKGAIKKTAAMSAALPGSFYLFGIPKQRRRSYDFLPCYRSEKIIRRNPYSVDGKMHWKFSRDLAETHRYTTPNAYSVCLDRGIASSGGAILDCYCALIPELSKQFDLRLGEDHKITRSIRVLPKIKHFSGSVAAIAFQGQSNYFHWMFDALPQLHLLEKSQLHPERLYLECHTPFQQQSLSLLGYGQTEIIDSCQHEFISAERLIAPSFPGKSGYVPGWVCDYLRDRFLPLSTQGTLPLPDQSYRQIYLSRKNASRRKVTNERELAAYLSSKGFIEVQTDDLSLVDQIRLFQQAETVVSPHGAGLTNLIFCNSGTQVIELFSPQYVNGCYWTLCEQIGLDYYYLIGEADPQDNQSSEFRNTPDNVTGNMEIKIDKLEKLFRLAKI